MEGVEGVCETKKEDVVDRQTEELVVNIMVLVVLVLVVLKSSHELS